MTQLLVSVRNVSEAAMALAGGAAIIDVKEPAQGSLGRADNCVIVDVLRSVADRRPVSAALGELQECQGVNVPPGLSFAKWGLSGCGQDREWRHRLLDAARMLPPSCEPVAVAYADWERAKAPPPDEVVAFAIENGWRAFLLDTFQKNGCTLFHWLSTGEIAWLSECCRGSKIRIAIAGSLGPKEIDELRSLEPNFFAVRGAACQGGRRSETISAERVRCLATLVNR